MDNLKVFLIENKIFSNTAGTWEVNVDGNLCLVYQTEENGFIARSFEDSFIGLNRDFVNDNKDNFKGLQNRAAFDIATNAPYALAAVCIKKKTHFALDILYHSNEDFSNWQIPAYIKEGLSWLKQG